MLDKYENSFVVIKRKLETIGIAVLFGIGLALICAYGAEPRSKVVLTSDYPTNELSTNLWFKVYSSTNASTPVTTWPLIAIVPGTNATFTLPIDAVQRFYVVKASNSWWRIDSDFSNTAATEPVPREVSRLRISLDQ